jgi:hypothetical protein
LQNYFLQGFAGFEFFEKINEFIIMSPVIRQFIGLATILIELSAVFLLVTNGRRWLIVVLIAFLQIGFYVGLYINFYPWFVLYLVWIVSGFNDYLEKIIIVVKDFFNKRNSSCDF